MNEITAADTIIYVVPTEMSIPFFADMLPFLASAAALHIKNEVIPHTIARKQEAMIYMLSISAANPVSTADIRNADAETAAAP